MAPIYQWKGLSANALRDKLKGVRENLQNVNNMTEVYYPGLKDIHSKWDAIYEKINEITSNADVSKKKGI